MVANGRTAHAASACDVPGTMKEKRDWLLREIQGPKSRTLEGRRKLARKNARGLEDANGKGLADCIILHCHNEQIQYHRIAYNY